MRTLPVLAALLLAALPASAGPPGNVALTYGEVAASVFDFKDGVGIADPTDPTNPCTLTLLDVREPTPHLDYWKTDLRIGTNLNGPAVGVSNLVGTLPPPWQPVGGAYPNSGGIPLGVPCPLGGPGGLWLVWSGMNWRSAEEDGFAQFNFCSQLPGTDCVPIPNTQTVVAAACTDWSTATFSHDYTDGKAKDMDLWDALAMKNDAIACPTRHAHDYSSTISIFGVGFASQGPIGDTDRIKNEAVVHAGTGTTYLVVCWQIDYLMFPGPTTPFTARGHDWKLIVDLGELPLGAANVAAALVNHLGPGAADTGPGGPTALLRGLYSESPTPAGENGYGPCPLDTDPTTPGVQLPPLPERKKPGPFL